VSDAPFGPPEHELKLEVDRFRTAAMAAQLQAVCRPDPKYPANIVNSIYFDTPDLAFVGEKANSDFLKTKVRLRWYEEDDGSATSAFLEVKKRIGSRRRKARLGTSLSGEALRALPLDSSDLLSLPDRLRRAGISLPNPLLPLITIRYRRQRFLDPFTGSRVCLDTDIHTAATHPRTLQAPGAGTDSLPGGVLEIKGSRDTAPPSLTHLPQSGTFKSSYSKYGRCYAQLTGEPS